jgi:Ca2+-binding RTX toxin-like protein
MFSTRFTARRPRQDRKAQLAVTSLEGRQMLSVTAIKFGASSIYGTKQVEISTNGSASNVSIGLASNQIEVKDSSNGFSQRLSSSGIGAVVYFGGGANDRVVNNIPGVQLRAYGFGGDDYLQGSGSGDVLDGGDGNDTLYGGGGNDEILGRGGADRINGDGGDDTLRGGDNNDTLDGGDGNDQLFGDAGRDYLDGGSGSSNWLEAGSATEPALNGWNAHAPVVGGMTYTDISQAQMGSCAFLSSLAAAVKSKVVDESFLTYQGDFTYRIKFFDSQQRATYQNATFDGRIATYSGARLDPYTSNYEFWPIIYQRAYYQKFHSLNYVTNPKAGYDFGGEHTDQAMTRLMPYTYARFATGSAEFTVSKMQSILNGGWAMTASLTAWATDAKTGKWAASNHAYVVTRVYQVFGLNGGTDTYVELYNPWGKDTLHGKRRDKTSVDLVDENSVKGRFSISWADFKSMANYYAW